MRKKSEFLIFLLDKIKKGIYLVLLLSVELKKILLRLAKQYYIYLVTGSLLIVTFINGLIFSDYKLDLLLQSKNEQLIIEKAGDYSEKPDFTISVHLDREMPATSLEGGALVAPELTDNYPIERTKIINYEVQPGDNIEKIAKKFGISVNSILWENKLTRYSIIRPGQILRILPITGVSHKVKYGETLERIAKRYKVPIEDIVDYNNLENAKDAGQKLKEER